MAVQPIAANGEAFVEHRGEDAEQGSAAPDITRDDIEQVPSTRVYSADGGSGQRSWNDLESSRYVKELRTILSRLSKGQARQSTPQRIVIASVSSGMGASAIARGLAAASAGSGFRVLLVDTNLDRPTVHQHFGLSNDFGLSDLLASSGSPHRLPQSTAMPNLAVIVAGPKLSNYSSLLARERVFHRLQPISRHFDYIIADCSSLSASLVSRVSVGADNVIITVKEHDSSMKELENMVRTLRGESVPEPAVLMIE